MDHRSSFPCRLSRTRRKRLRVHSQVRVSASSLFLEANANDVAFVVFVDQDQEPKTKAETPSISKHTPIAEKQDQGRLPKRQPFREKTPKRSYGLRAPHRRRQNPILPECLPQIDEIQEEMAEEQSVYDEEDVVVAIFRCSLTRKARVQKKREEKRSSSLSPSPPPSLSLIRRVVELGNSTLQNLSEGCGKRLFMLRKNIV
jgi:hypothetical protein